MAFLFQDQNQGIRNDAPRARQTHGSPQPFSFIRTLTVGFGFAPNLLTLPLGREGARGLGLFALTAGGDFHPALRTSAGPEWADLPRNMNKAAALGKPVWPGKSSWSPCPEREALPAPGALGVLPLPVLHGERVGVRGSFRKCGDRRVRGDSPLDRIYDAIRPLPASGARRWMHRIKNRLPPKVNNFLPAPIRFRFVLILTNALWTVDSHVVESSEVRLRRFRKSHHLIPAGPRRLGSAAGKRRAIYLRRQRINQTRKKKKVETACPCSKP